MPFIFLGFQVVNFESNCFSSISLLTDVRLEASRNSCCAQHKSLPELQKSTRRFLSQGTLLDAESAYVMSLVCLGTQIVLQSFRKYSEGTGMSDQCQVLSDVQWFQLRLNLAHHLNINVPAKSTTINNSFSLSRNSRAESFLCVKSIHGHSRSLQWP